MNIANEINAGGSLRQPENTGILNMDVKDVASVFWKHMQQQPYFFLEKDVTDIAKEIFGFLNKDVVGQKIILLDQEKLRTANAAARILKRKRRISKTREHKAIISKIKKNYKYLHHSFWQNSSVVRGSRKYLDGNLRRMTPAIMKGLAASVKNLRRYFNGEVLDIRILATDGRLYERAMDFGYKKFTVCVKYQQPLAKDVSGDIICSHTDCSTRKCPFEANRAHGEEVVFLSGLGELIRKRQLQIIRDEQESLEMELS